MNEPIWRFPFIGMEPGDSFCVPTNDADRMKLVIDKEAVKFGIKVRTKVRVEDGILVVRCWMLKNENLNG